MKLIAAEEEWAELEPIRARFHRAGVDEVLAVGDGLAPDGIEVRGPALDVATDIDSGLRSPVRAALVELDEFLSRFGPLIQLHVASTDMDLVATAARELTRYRHRPGSADPVAHNPYTLVEGPLESGVIVVYARSFTGHARLGDRWLPPEGPGRDLHRRLLELRQHHAHADWTHTRTLVDTNAMLEIEGPPVLAERRKRLTRDELEQIADLAERQHSRFLEAAGWLKIELGVGNAPWWWLVGDEDRPEPE